METRSQKRKREIGEKLKKIEPRVNTKINTKKSNKENIDIKKNNALQQQIREPKLIVSLDRLHLSGCTKKHFHAIQYTNKNEDWTEMNHTMTVGNSSLHKKRKREVPPTESIIKLQQVDNRITASKIPISKQNARLIDKVTEENCSKKKKTPDEMSEDIFNKKPTILNSFEQCVSLHNSDQTSGEIRKSKRKREIPINAAVNRPNQIEKQITAAKKPKSVEKEKIYAGPKNNRLELEERIKLQEPVNHFFENEIVLATIPGYAPWPARILGINAETIFVEFFGTGQINPVRSGALNRFDIKKAILLLQRRGYRKAIRELELVLGIPHDVSVIQ